MTEEKVSTIHLWGHTGNKPTKTSIAVEINKKLGTVADLNALTLADLALVDKALAAPSHTDFSSCRSKKDYVTALSRVIPGAKSLHRIGLSDLKLLSKAFEKC